MSASTFRSMVSTVSRHKVEPTPDVLYYDATDLWESFYSPDPSCNRRREIPTPQRIDSRTIPPKKLPDELSPDKYRIVRVVVISDTHEYHPLLTIPPADLLLHCGDILQADSFTVMERFSLTRFKAFLEWFGQQPCRHKILIGGNHDLLLQNSPLDDIRRLVEEIAGASYIEDEVLRFKKDLTITPASMAAANGAATTAKRRKTSSVDDVVEVAATTAPHCQTPPPERDPCAGLTVFGSPRSVPNNVSPNKAFQDSLAWHRAAYPLSVRELKAYKPLPDVLRRLRDAIFVEAADGSLTLARVLSVQAPHVDGKESQKKGKDHHKKHIHTLASAEGQPLLLNPPTPMVAHIRLQIAKEAAGGNFEDVNADGKHNKALNAVRKYNSTKGPQYATAALEVFSIRAYQLLWSAPKAGNHEVPQVGDEPFTPKVQGPPGSEVLRFVEPLKGIDIAMTHMSLSGTLQELVETFLRPRLMHAGGHLHECKGIHNLYRIPSGETAATAPRCVPSVGGAMTRGRFGKEWIQPATVLDFVVPWDE